jgi:hypothetical protein
MAHDDEKPETGDDPWASLESDGLPELGAEFAFSFEEQIVEGDDGDAGGLVADDAAAAIDAVLDGGLEAEADPLLSSLPDSIPESLSGGLPDAAPEATMADEPEFRETPDSSAAVAADAEIDDWLSGASDGDAAASSVLGAGAFAEAEDAAGEFPDFMAGDSSVNIGTGTSGIISPSGIDAAGDHEPVASGDEADPFAGLAAEPMDWASAEPTHSAADQADGDAVEREPADDLGGAFDVAGMAVAGGAAVAAGSGEPKRAAGKATRSAPPRKKQPSMVGQMIGVVLGGAMAIPITLAILIWGFGKDPFNLTPMLPESVAFLLPQQFRPAAGLPKFPSFQTPVSTPPASQDETVDDGEAALPSADDLVGTEPEPTDLASTEPVAPLGAGEPAVDPAMDVLDEPAPAATPAVAVVPAPPPEPEPLDLAKLGVAIADAQAALEAVAAVDDPSDPVRRRLLAKWYLALAGYAEELAALERLAAETGRPFEPAAEQAAAIRAGLADHPQLVAELSRLTREWIAYSKRSRDGVVMPATFVLADRVGPYWRSQVTLPATDKLPAREMVVLTRAEPNVAPGDEVVIVGLAVDDDVVWASELRPAAAAGFPGL